jgi:hypothetical protein
MTLDEFTMLAEAWGADIGRWPEHLRAAAADLAGRPEAAAVLAEADRVDRLIIAGKPDVSSDRIDRAIFGVVGTIAGKPHRTGSQAMRSLRRWLIPAASFATAAVLGVSLGLVRPLNMPRSAGEAPALTMILDTGSFGPDWVLR